MHHIYETEAFVISAVPRREADREIMLYTREFGMVRATAQGLRELKSKLRYSLQPYSQSVVNLVRGRAGWRITNARLERDIYASLRREKARALIAARAFSLVRRMVQGQEANEELYHVLSEGFRFLETVPSSALADTELVLVLRMLHALGYIGDVPAGAPTVLSRDWDERSLAEAARIRALLVQSVNESLRASHL